MTTERGRPDTPLLRFLRRSLWALGIYLAVGLATSILGFNLLGAVFKSGPLFGRITDADGHGIAGAFVSYEWSGSSYHGSTGCEAAAITRTWPGGFYIIPWQGWRLFYAYGWGISPAGPAVWAPGYVAISDGHGGSKLVLEGNARASERLVGSEYVDKGACFGWIYRSMVIELRQVRFDRAFHHVCADKATLSLSDLAQISYSVADVDLARQGDPLGGSVSMRVLQRKYEKWFEKIAWPKRPNDAGVQVTPDQRDDICTAVATDYSELGRMSQ